jgi:di/tricarboxylate transporter
MFAAVILVLMGAIKVEDFLGSFSNKSVITIFLLIYLTAIINKHFPFLTLMDRVFKKAKTTRSFIFQMTSVVSLISGVMNNTPLVSLFIPYVYQWGRKHKVAPSKLLIPLSYASIIGGMITVIGTSTNLVLNSFIRSSGDKVLTFSDFFIPGIIVSLCGVLFLTFFSNKLLPNRELHEDEPEEVLREYLAETRLEADSALVGKTIQEAGLRNLDGVYLAQIYRNGNLLKAVTPEVELHAGDRLYFAGDTVKVTDVIKRFSGIVWAKAEKFEISEKADIVETLIPANSVLQGKSLKELEFRDRFDAAVIAIHRNGSKAQGKLGEIELTAGDLLLLMAGPNFRKKVAEGKDLYTLNWVKDEGDMPKGRNIFLVALLFFIGLSAFGVIDFFVALILSLVAAAVLKMFDVDEAKKQTSLELLLILGGAITVGKAFIDTGAAQLLIEPLLNLIQSWGPIPTTIILFFLTVTLTSFVTNAAAVAMVFPLAFELIKNAGLNPTAAYLALAFGASAAFLTPIGYQTNLMVFGPGKYKFVDFFKIGLPFLILYSATALITIFAVHNLL